MDPTLRSSAAMDHRGSGLSLFPRDVLLAGGEGAALSFRASRAQSSVSDPFYPKPAFRAFYNGAHGSHSWILSLPEYIFLAWSGSQASGRLL